MGLPSSFWRFVAAWLLWSAVLPGLARAETPLPELGGRVNDGAGLLDGAARAQLEAELAAYERATGHQFALVTVQTLDGLPIEDFSIRLAEKWKLGDAKRDDGLLLIVAARDHKMRIEVGYGLEGAIPDALAARVVRYELGPAFRQGQYAQGITRAFQVLEKAAQGEAVRVGPANDEAQRASPSWFRYLPLLLFLLIFLLNGRGRGGGGSGGFWAGMLLGSMSSRDRGYGGYHGGGFGGGGGGFGGGGGGFGGGGASGDW